MQCITDIIREPRFQVDFSETIVEVRTFPVRRQFMLIKSVRDSSNVMLGECPSMSIENFYEFIDSTKKRESKVLLISYFQV